MRRHLILVVRRQKAFLGGFGFLSAPIQIHLSFFGPSFKAVRSLLPVPVQHPVLGSSFSASRRRRARPDTAQRRTIKGKATFLFRQSRHRPDLQYATGMSKPKALFVQSSLVFPGNQPNYAIKVTSVRTLLQSFTSGASAPYFGC